MTVEEVLAAIEAARDKVMADEIRIIAAGTVDVHAPVGLGHCPVSPPHCHLSLFNSAIDQATASLRAWTAAVKETGRGGALAGVRFVCYGSIEYLRGSEV